MAIALVACDEKLFKWDDETGESWILLETDDGDPEWVVIKNREAACASEEK